MTSFLDIINKKLDKQAAIKTKPKTKISLTDKPWMSRAIKKSIKTKNQIYEHFFLRKQINHKGTLHDQFKTYRNYLVTLTRNSKESYFAKYFEDNKKHTKKVWKAIRTTGNVKPTNKYQPKVGK